MKWKTLTILALIVCLLIFSSKAYGSVTTTEPFNLYFENGSNFSMVCDNNRPLQIEVTSGTLNGTNATLTLSLDAGQLSFYSYNATSITLTCNDGADLLNLAVNGATTLTHDDSFIYSATLPALSTIGISWSWSLESFIDKYSMLALGVFSVFLLVFGPLWVAWGIKKEGFNEDTMKRVMWCMVMVVMGIGLLIMWLWR